MTLSVALVTKQPSRVICVLVCTAVCVANFGAERIMAVCVVRWKSSLPL